MNTGHDRARTIFAEAMKLPGGGRAAYLRGACGGDAELLAEVERLLQRHRDAEIAPDQRREHDTVETVVGSTPAREQPGASISRYKLLERLGEGGFGAVWLAEQKEPVRRKIALKLIKLGMDTQQVVARFEAERQALAMMDHPNIAKVLDAGSSETGRPYFVMELVRGIPITRFCEENQLSIPDRLELFIKVCQAIQHAHQKGIIHRDVKPSNILVTLDNGLAIPKVIDFGIAKATQAELTEKTIHTQFHQFIGTPAYMSPEQAERSGLDIDTRSDIYSLGVLLYELLTGTTPFNTQELLRAGVDEMRRIIREREPVPPSTRISRTQSGKAGQGPAPSPAPKQSRQARIDRDLDWIVLKCLEKDRTRRYETANGLAVDLKRYLSDEPVLARPPSPTYKLQKAWRRNRLVFTSGIAVFLALLIGGAVSAWQAVVARQARSSEAAERVKAERAEEEAMENAAAAQNQRQKAEAAAHEAKLHRYVSDIGVAYRLLQEGSLTEAEKILRDHRPGGPGQPDFRGFEWHYLWRLCQGDALRTFRPHQFPLESLSLSADGQWIAATSSRGAPGYSPWNRTAEAQPRGELVIFAAESQQPLAARATNMAPPTVTAFFPSERAVLVGHADGGLSRWSGELFAEGQKLRGRHGDSVRTIAFSPAGDFFATGGLDGTVLLWRTADGELVWDEVTGWPVWDVAFSPDGRLLAVVGQAEEVQFLDLETRSRTTTRLTEGWATCLEYSPTIPGLLFVGRMNSSIIGLHTSSGESFVLGKHGASITDVQFLPDGTTLVSAALDHAIGIWDTAARQSLGILKGHTDAVWQLAVSPNGHRIYSASADRTLKQWEPRRPQQFDLVHQGSNWVGAVEFSGDGHWLAGNVWDNTVRLWDVNSLTETERHLLSIDNFGVKGLGFDWRRQRMIVGNPEGMIEIWDARVGQKLFRAHAGHLFYVALSADGRLLATATGSRSPRHMQGELKLWETETFQPAGVRWTNDVGISRMVFTPDGSRLAIGGSDGVVTLVETASGRRIGQEQGHAKPVWAMAVSADGKRLATGSLDDSLVCLWELARFEKVADLTCVSASVESLAFAADARTLVAGYGNGKIRFWNLESQRELFALEAHNSFIPGLWFASDGTTLASGSADGSVKLWPSRRYPPRP